MEKIVEKTLLYDFYGELLTAHQQSVYEDVVFNDMSLSEAAETYGVSRQGIHDMLRRCDKALLEYEEKLHLIAHFEEIRKTVQQMETILQEKESIEGQDLKKLLQMTEEILSAL